MDNYILDSERFRILSPIFRACDDSEDSKHDDKSLVYHLRLFFPNGTIEQDSVTGEYLIRTSLYDDPDQDNRLLDQDREWELAQTVVNEEGVVPRDFPDINERCV